MQTKLDELRSLLSRNFVRSFTQFRAKLRAKVRPQNEISWKYRAIFRKVKRKTALAKIHGNKKDLQSEIYSCKSVAAIDVASKHTAGRSMPECSIPVFIRLENNF